MGVERVELGYTTEVDVRGAGPDVVLVHGTPLDRHSWQTVGERLARERRVITYDLRGHGCATDSAVPDSYDTLADDLAALLDHLGVEDAHVVGHSFGGQVVARFALAHPERLRSLSIVCARLTPFPPFAAAAERIAAGEYEAIGRGGVERWFTRAAIEADAPGVRYSDERLRATPPSTLQHAFELIAKFDGGPQLSALRVPLRIILAARDTVATGPELDAIAAGAADGRLTTVPDAGHMMPLEHPQMLARLLEELPGKR